jgi:polysaccharide pyruvyl transferase WcaK-like protein
MRLHGAILSMLGGTPAMGLAYEEKTKGIFSSLGFENYQVNFDDSFDTWKQCTQTFLAEMDLIRNRLPGALDREAGKATESITILENTLATL